MKPPDSISRSSSTPESRSPASGTLHRLSGGRAPGGRAPTLLVGLGLALLLVLVPVQVRSAFAACGALGFGDTATGNMALCSEAGGQQNTADGASALTQNKTGLLNTAVGSSALGENISGSQNTAVGAGAITIFTGSDDTALGIHAGSQNVAGANNTFLGSNTEPGLVGLTNATAVGANAVVGESNALVLGNGAQVGIGTSTPDSELTVAGTIESTSGGIKFPDGSTQATAGVASVNAAGVLASTGGRNPIISLSGVIPTGSGGTGIAAAPSVSGQFLRSSAAGHWSIGALMAADLPAGSTHYIQTGTTPQPGASFNISGSGAIGGSLTVGSGVSSVRGPLGVGMQTPHSLLQVGMPSTDYAAFFQPPTVLSAAPPPAGTCNTTTFVGRMVLQFNPITKKTTLWACSAAGQWAGLGQG